MLVLIRICVVAFVTIFAAAGVCAPSTAALCSCLPALDFVGRPRAGAVCAGTTPLRSVRLTVSCIAANAPGPSDVALRHAELLAVELCRSALWIPVTLALPKH